MLHIFTMLCSGRGPSQGGLLSGTSEQFKWQREERSNQLHGLRPLKLGRTGRNPPEHVHLPSVYVHRVVELTPEQAADKHI